ncbi:MAG TPA: zinc-binding dehydrogenase [Acidimicrobiales bacterium]|nr:zinc-binding dehydrogenase [Acidimicrobiales bacterium]
MKAALLVEPGSPLEVGEVELEGPRAGEVLVRVEAAGICHSDYHYMAGDLRCRLPAVLGHEGAGIVEAVGPGVTRVAEGQAVCLLWRPRCGECRHCLAGHAELCVEGRALATSGGLLDGTSRLRVEGVAAYHFLGVSCFAEACVVPERSVVPVPEGVPLEVAAIAGCAVITGVGSVLNAIGACSGQGVVVLGAGGVGCAAVMGAASGGAFPVVAVDRNPEALELARRVGATHSVTAGEGDLLEAIAEACPGGADWSIEAIGRPDTLRAAISCLRPGGTAVAVGLAPLGATVEVTINEIVQQEKHLRGSLYGSATPALELPRLFGLYLAGRLPLERLLGGRYRLEEVNTAYAELLAGRPGRSVIVPPGSGAGR